MSKKVTDLEKFALEQVMRPYWPTLIGLATPSDKRLWGIPSIAEPAYPSLIHSIDIVAKMLDVGPLEWRLRVFDRIRYCGFYFPDYIDHRLVTVVRAGMSLAAASREDEA